MDRYLSPVVFSADDPTDRSLPRPSFSVRTAQEAGLKEDWLQRAIAAEPEVAVSACREADLTDEIWMFWAKEFVVDPLVCQPFPMSAADRLLIPKPYRIAFRMGTSC